MITTGAATINTVAVGATSTVLAAANSNRKHLVITNISDEAVFVAEGTAAVANKGIALAAAGTGMYNGKYETGKDGILYTGPVYGICASGAKNVAVHES